VHEVGIIQNAVILAEQRARSVKASRVHCLRLRVGALSGVVPDALEFAFDVVRRGTLAEEAQLEVENVPAAGWCARCQTEFECEDYSLECPLCHQFSSELRRGRELELTSIEVS
jgi:hydrogenase nickel incorporation protein HypA/HybF